MGGGRGPRRAGGASLLGRAALAVAAVAAAAAGLAGGARADAAAGQVRLVSQTPWVVPGETLSLALRTADVTDPAAVELAVTVYPAVKSRVELARSTLGDGLKAPIWPRANNAVPLRDVPARVDGTLSMEVPTRDPRQPADPTRATLSQPGIYPVQVELREIGGGDTVQRFTTHLLAVKPPSAGGRLGAAVVLPLSAPPSTGLEGRPSGPPAGASALADAAAGLAAAPLVPLTLVPTPEVLASLADSDPTTTAALGSALAARDVLGRTFVPVDVPSLGAAAATLLPQQLQAGREATRAVLDRDPIDGTWLADEPLDGPSLARVVQAGSPRLVLAQGALGPTGPAVPAPRQPVAVTGGGATATALVADSTLAAPLDGRGAAADQPLIAHHLLADLAAIATLPADQGAPPPDGPLADGVVTVVASRAFTPTSGFLTELLGGLATSPVLQAVDLAAGFALPAEPPPPPPRSAGPTGPRRGTTTALPAATGRTLVPPPPGDRDISAEVGAAAVQLSTLGQVLADPAPADGSGPDVRPGPTSGGVASVAELRRRLLVATSADLPADQRRARLGALIARATGDLQGLKMPERRTLRLTARTGQIPVGIFNETGRTARVLLQLDSDKLEFPAGNRTQVVLDRRTNTSRILVRVRASGGFPVRVRLLTPDGSRVLQETTYVVRADTFPGVAIAVSGAAAVFLAVWWARTLLTGGDRHGRHRRRRRRAG